MAGDGCTHRGGVRRLKSLARWLHVSSLTGQEVFIQDVVRRGRAQEERRASRRGGELKACDSTGLPEPEPESSGEERRRCLQQAAKMVGRYTFGGPRKAGGAECIRSKTSFRADHIHSQNPNRCEV